MAVIQGPPSQPVTAPPGLQGPAGAPPKKKTGGFRDANLGPPTRAPRPAPRQRVGAPPGLQGPEGLPAEPPHPALQAVGFNGGVNEFNHRVATVTTAHVNAFGYKPPPGVALDAARSSLPTPSLDALFDGISLSPRANQSRQLGKQARLEAGIPDTQPAEPVALLNGLTEAARTGNYEDFAATNEAGIHALLADPRTHAKAAGVIFAARRLSLNRELDEKVNNGEITGFEARDRLQAAGFLPGSFPAVKGIGGFIATTLGQIADALVHSPAGTYELGKAVALDTAASYQHPLRANAYPRSKKIVKGIGEQYVRDFSHPLQDPGFLFLDALGLASLGGGAVAKLGTAGRALSEGEGAAAAGRALVAKPKLQSFEISKGGHTENVPLSQNPLVAEVQKVILGRRQAKLDIRHDLGVDAPAGLLSILLPDAAETFLAQNFSLETKIGREADARRRIEHTASMGLARELDALAGRSIMQARALSRVPAKIRGGLSRGEQKAIQAQSWDIEGGPLAKIQAESQFHQRMIDTGVGDPAAHKRQIADLKLAVKAVEKQSPRFTKALEMTQRLMDDQEADKIRELGLLPETAEGRVAKAGAVLRGEPLVGSKPVFPPDALFHGSPEGELGNIDALYHTQTWREGQGFYATTSYDKASKYAAGRTARGERRGSPGAVNVVRLKAGAKILNVDTVGESFWRNLAEKIVGEPVNSKTWTQWANDIRPEDAKGASIGVLNRLRLQHLLTGWAEMPHTDAYYAIEEALADQGFQATKHMEGGVPVYVVKDSAAVAKVHKSEIGSKPAPLERVTEDSFYLPTQPRGKVKRPPGQTPGYFPKKAGPFGVSPGRELAELTHEFNGDALRAGDMRIDATSLATEAYARTARALSVKQAWNEHWAASTPTPRSEFDIPIRDVNRIPDKLREVMARLDEGDFSKTDAAVLPADMRTLIEAMYPEKRLLTEEDIPHVRWVDGRTLGNANEIPVRPGPFGQVAQLLNAPIRFAILYARPAYILNKLGNAAMLAFDQGWATVPNMARAMSGNRLYGEDVMRSIYDLTGSGKSRSYVTSQSGRVSKAVAEFWNRVADRDERAAAFIHYARRMGYKTKAEMNSLVHDTANSKDLVEVTRRANKSLVEFDNLSAFEKNYMRHIIFVYPWVRGATVWSLRAIMEHPAKTDLLAQLGRYDEDTDPIFKEAPEWFKRIGYVPLGWDKGVPKVINPTSVNTFTTMGDWMAIARGATIGDKYASVQDLLGPAASLALHAASGRDQYGNQYVGSQLLGAMKEVLVSLPQLAPYEKAQKADKPLKPVDITRRSSLMARLNSGLKQTVFSPGWLDGYGSLLAGGLSPKTVNEDALVAKYWRDQPLAARHKLELTLLNKAVGMQADLLGHPVPTEVRRAVRIQADLSWQYAQHLKDTGRSPTDKERGQFTLDYLKEKGRIAPNRAVLLQKRLDSLVDKSDIARFTNSVLLDTYGNGKQLRQWDTDVRTVASFTPKVFDEKTGRLFAQGLVQQKTYHASQKQLTEYGRAFVAFTHEAQKLKDGGANAAELRAFEDLHDKPVNGLPSFVRIAWTHLTAEEQAKTIAANVTNPWPSLSRFEKQLLGRNEDPRVAAGYLKLDQFVTQQREAQARNGESLPTGYIRTLAKYVEKYYDAPGLTASYDFSRLPLFQRMQYLKPIQNSPNATLWKQLYQVQSRYWQYLKSPDYSHTQVRQNWRDYVNSDQFKAWLKDNPKFRAEVTLYGGPKMLGRSI